MTIQKDLRVKKTLKQIDNALLDILSETSFDKITVDELCRTAIINRSTFYKYYKNKNDLLNNYLNRVIERFKQQIDAAFVTASPENIHNVIYQKNFERVLNFMYKHKREYLILWDYLTEERVFAKMVQAVQDRMLEKLSVSKNTPEIDLYARLFSYDMMTIVSWWFKYENEISITSVKEIMMNNMKQGVFRTFREYIDVQLKQTLPESC